GELDASLPAEELVLGGGAPQYDRPYETPAYLTKTNAFNPASIAVPADLKATAEKLITIPNIASKRAVYVQYDSMVGTGNTSTNGPSDAAIVLAKPSEKALAVTTDCNSRYVYADPYKGAMIAVAEAARNIVCSGGEPLGVTNCLNFGNPYDPQVYYQFVNAIKGMGDACRRFNTPVTGGNVSFYNQHPEGAVYPTPTIGMVGLLDNWKEKMTLSFVEPGDAIYLIGQSTNCINSSEYLHKLHGVEFSPAPHFDIDEELALQQAVTLLIKNKLIKSAHDLSEGGLFVALTEAGFFNNLGFSIATDAAIRPDAYLFGEGQSRVIVTVSAGQQSAFESTLGTQAFTNLGIVTPGELVIDGDNWGTIGFWKEKYDTAIEKLLAGHAAEHAMTTL
nr:AIR synthase related protein [Flavihumibacter sp.]